MAVMHVEADDRTTDELLAEAMAAVRYQDTIRDSLATVQQVLNLPYLPNHKQAVAHLHEAQGADQPLLYGGAMGGGKSSWESADAIRECREVPGNRVLMARRELKTFRATTLQTLLRLIPPEARHNKSDQMFIFPNGAQLLYGGLGDDDDKRKLLSAEYGALYFDEVNELEETSFQLALTRLRWAPALGRYKVRCTCNPWPGWVKERWITNPRPGHHFIPALPLDNLHNLPPDYIDVNRAILPLDWFRAFMLGDWNASMPVDAVFGPMVLDRAMRVTLIPGEDCVWGVDVARFGNDLTVVGRRRGNVYDFVPGGEWRKTPVDETADNLVSLIAHARPVPRIVNIDDDGVGGGVTDLTRRYQREGKIPSNVRINGVMAQRGATQDTAHAFDGVHYANVKAQLMYAMLRRAEQEGIQLPPEPTELKSGLEAYRKEVRMGKVHILPKATVKQLLGFSPDHADAMVLTEFIGRADYVARSGGGATPDALSAEERAELERLRTEIKEEKEREKRLLGPRGVAGRYGLTGLLRPQLRRPGDVGY